MGTEWSLLTAEIDGGYVAAVRRSDGSLVVPELLRGYDGLMAVLEDWEDLKGQLQSLDLSQLAEVAGSTACAPIRYPRKIIGGGPNYTDHMAEMGAHKAPEGASPFFYFVPPSTTIIGDGQSILIPSDPAASVDWEAELAVVIGHAGRDIAVEEALSYVAGYACLNDVTARGLMRKVPALAEPFAWDWAACKGLDTFCPLGPMTPTWFVPEPGDLSIRCLVNGVAKQDSSTSNMMTGIAELIAEASRFWSLEPGDVIGTGTPAGVGFARGERLTDGDEVRIEIAGLVPITNTVRFRTPASQA